MSLTGPLTSVRELGISDGIPDRIYGEPHVVIADLCKLVELHNCRVNIKPVSMRGPLAPPQHARTVKGPDVPQERKIQLIQLNSTTSLRNSGSLFPFSQKLSPEVRQARHAS